MPALGFGTWGIPPAQVGQAVKDHAALGEAHARPWPLVECQARSPDSGIRFSLAPECDLCPHFFHAVL